MLDRLEALAKQATPGPWILPMEPDDLRNAEIQSANGDMVIYDEGGHGREDAEFIAACDPDTILKLVDIVKDLAAENPNDWDARCRLCAEYASSITQHEPKCPWRRAIELAGSQ